MIQLFQGSIFSSKCDLIIIPCNDMGGVSAVIQEELIANKLPHLNKPIKTGEVVYIQSIGDFENASMIGYAASVDVVTHASDENILREILRSIKQCCYEQSLHKINIPLLGTGAGQLCPKTSWDIMNSEFGEDTNLQLCVYAIMSYMYNELVSEKNIKINNCIRNPRVFISYTGTDIENRKWVKDFACKLRKSGINARLDMFHLRPGQDLPQWMTNEIIMADKVLLICDKYYTEKEDNRNGGVGWETMIIQGDMLSRQEQNKYIIIQREPNIDQSLPIYVKSRYALNWSDEDVSENDFNDLLLYLFDCDLEPPIGEIPNFVIERLRR